MPDLYGWGRRAMWTRTSQRDFRGGIGMTIHGAHGAQEAVWDEKRPAPTLTVGWFVRRSALWLGIMIVALILACSLYAFASQGGEGHGAKGTPSESKI